MKIITSSSKDKLGMHTSQARGTRPSTVVTTDQTNVAMFKTRVSETPENKLRNPERIRNKKSTIIDSS